MNPITIYIPRMSALTTESDIRNEFCNHHQIGMVSRVDFISVGQQQGFLEKPTQTNIKSAFVHLYEFYEHFLSTQLLLKKLKKGEGYKIVPAFSSEYWLLLAAKNPIKQTTMNTSQIVENCCLLEKKVVEQEETIKTLKLQMEGVSNVLYQFVGGLYCQRSQSSIINMHLNQLFSAEIQQGEIEKRCIVKEQETNKWSIWPTTRQGDSNEARIEALEAQIKALTDFGPLEEVFEEEEEDKDNEDQDSALQSLKHMREHLGMYYNDSIDSSSTHSSMPDLITEDDLNSVSSSASDIRVRISSELCGNE